MGHKRMRSAGEGLSFNFRNIRIASRVPDEPAQAGKFGEMVVGIAE
jgi:hypothetical protein